VVGKAGTGVVFLWMLLASSLPLAGICMVFGGVSPVEIVIVYALLAAWAFIFSAMGVFWSSHFAKTSLASSATFGTAICYTILTAICGSRVFVGGSGPDIVLSMLNPAFASENAAAMTRVFGVPVPVSLIAFIINAGLGILLITAAETHLRHHRADKALAVRLQLLGLTGFTLLMWMGSWSSALPASHVAQTATTRATLAAIQYLTAVMLLIFCFLPAFATGMVRCASGTGSLVRYLLSGFCIKRMLSRDLSGGLPFMLVWLAMCAGIGWVPFRIFTRPDSAVHFLQVIISMAAVTVGFFSLGVLMSSIFSNRYVAMAATAVLMLASFIVYPMEASTYQYTGPVGIRYQLAYFWPALPLVALGSEFDVRNQGSGLCSR
jgi:hypothetical protein